MIELVWMGFATGFAGSLHCASMCGGVMTALCGNRACSPAVPEKRDHTRAIFHAARAVSYGLAGAAFGSLGHVTSTWLHVDGANTFFRALSGVLVAFLGLSILGLPSLGVLFPARKQPSRLARAFARLITEIERVPPLRRAILLGLVWAFMPCGRLYAAFGLAALSTNPMAGAMVMFAFALGTWPGIAFFQHVLRWAKTSGRVWARRAVGVGALSTGVFLALEPIANASPFSGLFGHAPSHSCCAARGPR